MSAIRTRLLVWLLGAVVLTGVGAGWFIYRNALNEANAFFDYQLRQTALTLRDQSFQFAVPAQPLNELEYDFVIQVWRLDGVRVYLSQPHAVLPGFATLGLATVDTGVDQWRVFGIQGRAQVIQVAQPLSVRSARAARLAFRTLVPFASFMPLLAIAIWLLVGYGLRPLDRLARTVAARDPLLLQPLGDAALPRETQPLVAALNDLLGRLAAVRQRERAFIADAAHELRTPLTALRLQVEASAAAVTQGERERAQQQLVAGVERATRLVEQLLALARQDPGTPRIQADVALKALASAVVEEMLPLADAKGIDLGLAESTDCTVRGDGDALHALLRNLVDNAVRYTPEGGEVDVAVLTGPDGAAVLRFTDNGPGIPAQDRERVFERFARLPGVTALGSGLGLSIVRAVAEAHGARVELSTGPGSRGLAVNVLFPPAGRSLPAP